MNIDNNPFQCTDIMKKPPYGPFGTKTHAAYEVCGSNTFGPYEPLITYEIDSTRETIKYERAMAGIGGIAQVMDRFVGAYGAYIEGRAHSKNEYRMYCTSGLAVKLNDPAWPIGEFSVEQNRRCTRLLKRWYTTRELEDLTSGLGTLPTSEESAVNVLSSFVGPFNSKYKVYTVLSVISNLLNGGIVAVDLVRTYSTLEASQEWLGVLGPVLLYECKYASSKDTLPLHFCNYKSGGNAPRDVPRHCFLPLKGKLPTGAKTELYLTVSNGVKVLMPADGDTGGIVYLKRFFDDLSFVLGTKKSDVASLPHLKEIAITVSETANTISCTKSAQTSTYFSASDTPSVGHTYNFELPSSFNYQELSSALLGTCNDVNINFTPHYMSISDACHSLG